MTIATNPKSLGDKILARIIDTTKVTPCEEKACNADQKSALIDFDFRLNVFNLYIYIKNNYLFQQPT